MSPSILKIRLAANHRIAQTMVAFNPIGRFSLTWAASRGPLFSEDSRKNQLHCTAGYAILRCMKGGHDGSPIALGSPAPNRFLCHATTFWNVAPVSPGWGNTLERFPVREIWH